MKTLVASTILMASISLLPLVAEELNDEQKQVLLKDLEYLEKQTKKDAKGRYSKAFQAFRKAMNSPKDTTDLVN